MSRRKPLILDEAESPVAISGNWVFAPDGSLHNKLEDFQAGNIDETCQLSRFSLDPREIEVEVDSHLGRGACGIVYRGLHRPSNTLLAIKAVQVHDKSKRAQLMNDIQSLIKVQNCTHLVQLYAAYFHKESGRVHVALELMNRGSLEAILRKGVSPFPESVVATIIQGVLQGLEFLHAHKQVHRDVKPGNILLNSLGEVKLSDFGISKTLDNTANICDTFVGTATYMSPERAVGQDYSFSADIWSVGLVVYEIASGKFPFPATTNFPALFDYLCNKPEPRLVGPVYSSDLCSVVEMCLQREPQTRASARDLLSHAFFNLVDKPRLVLWYSMGGDKPVWIANWEKNTRQGKDSLDWFFRAFNRTKIYEVCLKSTPRFLTLCVVGSIVGTYAWSRMWENIWMNANRGKLFKDVPYVFPAEE